MTDNPDFAALVAAASNPEAVVVAKCVRCKQLHAPSADPDLVLCRRCLRQVQALFIEEDEERTDAGEEQRS